jgi:hypothetical protein
MKNWATVNIRHGLNPKAEVSHISLFNIFCTKGHFHVNVYAGSLLYNPQQTLLIILESTVEKTMDKLISVS